MSLRPQSEKASAARKAAIEASRQERRDAINRRMATNRIVRPVGEYARERIVPAEFVSIPKGAIRHADVERGHRPMNAVEQRFVDACCRLGCVVCRHRLLLETADVPCVWHHFRILGLSGAALKSPHVLGLALCPPHHDGHGAGVSYHSAPETWEAKYGTQLELYALQIEDLAREVLR